MVHGQGAPMDPATEAALRGEVVALRAERDAPCPWCNRHRFCRQCGSTECAGCGTRG